MKNSHIWPIEERLKYGRICKRCQNANDHEALMIDEARNRQRITCPECGLVTEKDCAQGTFEMRDGVSYLNGVAVELKTNDKGHAWIEPIPVPPQPLSPSSSMGVEEMGEAFNQ